MIFKLVILFFLLPIIAYGKSVDYSVPLGLSEWRYQGDPLLCELSLDIPYYGMVTFQKKHAENQQMILRSEMAPFAVSDASVYAKAPAWKRKIPPVFVTDLRISAPKSSVSFSEKQAEKIQSSLYQGKVIAIAYKSQGGESIVVNLPVDHFQEQNKAYSECMQALLPYRQDSVDKISLYFNENSYDYDLSDREKLDKIAKYVQADNTVQGIFIAAYTDNVGRRGHNNYISELRAEAAKTYFIRAGIPKEKIKITWFGLKNPKGDNETLKGRRENRRVEIKLLY